jgi:hypothetical protein
MTQQLDPFPEDRRSMVPAGVPNPSENFIPSNFADELDAVTTRVRIRLRNMSATIIEIGRELRAVKRRLKRGQFLEWTAACELAPRHAQLMIKAAEWAEGKEEIVSHLHPTAIYLLAARSTPEAVWKEVLFRLEVGERPAPGTIKAMIRAAKGDPCGALPDSEEDAIDGLLKHLGYPAVPDHLAQFPKRPTKGTQLAAHQNVPMDAEFTTPVSVGASPSATDARSEEIANVL